MTVYRQALATWYGPGFYGRRTACGAKMTHTLLGVAHRTLACGTMVAVSYKGRRVTVPVVDRGPFARGVSYDLTFATAQALGFAVTDRVGALPVAPPPPVGAERSACHDRAAMTLLSRRRERRVADAKIASPEEHTVIDARGGVRSIQAATSRCRRTSSRRSGRRCTSSASRARTGSTSRG